MFPEGTGTATETIIMHGNPGFAMEKWSAIFVVLDYLLSDECSACLGLRFSREKGRRKKLQQKT
jgi:hypothetical protein